MHMRQALLASAWLLSACVGSAPATQDGPAVITNASGRTHEEIRSVISAALHGAPVTISEDALTRMSFVTIERNQFRDERGLPVNGRDPGRPERFDLIRAGRQCVLVHERTGVRTSLKSVTCGST